MPGEFGDGEVDWEVLRSEFKRSGGRLRCLLMLELPQFRNALGGPGYAELVVRCRDVWFTPSAEEEPWLLPPPSTPNGTFRLDRPVTGRVLRSLPS